MKEKRTNQKEKAQYKQNREKSKNVLMYIGKTQTVSTVNQK